MAEKKLDFNNPLFRSEPLTNETTGRNTSRRRKEGIIRNEEGGQSSQEGLTAENTRFSVICKVENVKKIKDYAFTKRRTIKSVTDEIIETFFNNYFNDPNHEELLDHTRGNK